MSAARSLPRRACATTIVAVAAAYALAARAFPRFAHAESAPVAHGEPLDASLAAAGWQVLHVGHGPPTQFRREANGAIAVAADGGAAFLYRPLAPGEAAAQLTWRWQVAMAPPPSDPARAGHDDRPLAVHVLFANPPGSGLFDGIRRAVRRQLLGAPFAGRLITYMWGGTAPAGTRLANPYLPEDGSIVVLRDGRAPLGTWTSERVDPAADYAAAFGAPAPPPTHIAISADADDLGGRSLGWIADLAFVAPAAGRR
jgi:hypothetical protein